MLKPIQIAASLITIVFFSGCTNGFKLNAQSELDKSSGNKVIRSEYTPLDSESCKTIELDEETGYSTQSCPGYNNIPVFVSQTDGFYSVSIGERQNELGTIDTNLLGNLGDKLEWRLQDNEPLAVIYRHYIIYLDNATKPIDSVLVVRKMSGNIADCTMGIVGSNVPNANEVARRIADEQIAGECDVDSTERISN